MDICSAFDRNRAFGKGVAYATEVDGHLLNVPAASMSAHAEEPAHFLGWLKGKGRQVEENAFLPRGLCGAELARDPRPLTRRFTTVSADVRGLGFGDAGVALTLSDGRSLEVDQAVLCTGNFPPVSPVDEHIDEYCIDHYVADPWHSRRLSEVDPDDTVVLIGTSLTMVDVVLEASLPKAIAAVWSPCRDAACYRRRIEGPTGSIAGHPRASAE